VWKTKSDHNLRVSHHVPFGYVRDKEDKEKWLIDEKLIQSYEAEQKEIDKTISDLRASLAKWLLPYDCKAFIFVLFWTLI